MSFFNFLVILGLVTSTQAQDQIITTRFFCRLRIVNGTKEATDWLHRAFEVPQFEVTPKNESVATTSWTSSDFGEDPALTEIVYTVDVPDGAAITGYIYQTNWSIATMKNEQLNIRCSNITVFNKTSDAVKPTASFALTLGAPVTTGTTIRRPVTMERQTQLDCYVNGYVHPYFLDDKFYRYAANGEQFGKGCSFLVTCSNGTERAVSRCPPSVLPPNAQAVRKTGQCCEEQVFMNTVEKGTCPKDESGSILDPTRFFAYVPWQVRFGDSWKGCDGVILSKHWFLTTKTCINEMTRHGPDAEFIRPHSIVMQPPLFRNVSISETKNLDNNSTLNLVLVKINLPFVPNEWTTAIQPANLPWSKALCEKFLAKECRLLLGTLEADHKDPIAVSATITSDGPSAEVMTIKKQTNQPIMLGSGVVGWFEKANFLLAMYLGNTEATVANEQSAPYEDQADTGKVLSICPFIEAIRQVIVGDE